MTLVDIVWTMAAAASLTLAVIYGVVWLVDRRDRSSLMFCLLAVATAGAAPVELAMMHAATPVEYGEWVRWYQVPAFFVIVGQVFFTRSYLGTGRLWLAWSIVSARLVILIVTFVVSPNFNWRAIGDLRRISFLGEQVSVVGHVTVRSWQWLAVASLLLLIAYVADAAVQRWRMGTAESRRRALVVGAAVLAPLVLAVLLTQLVALGLASLPVINSPAFLLMVGVMAYELSRFALIARRAQQETLELRRQLARADRATLLGQLASALAHELGQPLAAIQLNAETGALLSKAARPDVEQLQAIISDICKDNVRAGQVVDRMRALINHRSLSMATLAVDELVKDAVSLVRAEAISKQIDVDAAVEDDGVWVRGDRIHLCQVLLNLIMNSMEAMEAGYGNSKRIVIEARTGAWGTVELTVTDTGPGIAPELVDKIFDPFFTTRPGGTGMGLAVSRSIVEAHGGRLWSEQSVDGRGVTFRFTLRRAVRNAPVAQLRA